MIYFSINQAYQLVLVLLQKYVCTMMFTQIQGLGQSGLGIWNQKLLLKQVQQQAIESMGNKCCSPELDSYEIKHEKVEMQKTQQEYRQGEPSQKIAIKLSDIHEKCVSSRSINHINRLVFRVVEYEKKFKQPMRTTFTPQLVNRLPDVYYLKSLDMFYIGEWVYNPTVADNVPGGVGRLFQQGTISEGVFKTYLLDDEEIQKLKMQQIKQGWQAREQSDQQNSVQLSSLSKQREMTSTRTINQKKTHSDNKIDKILKSGRKKIINHVHFVVKLHGSGRIHSKEEGSDNQVFIQGQFHEGTLNGKGTLKMTTIEIDFNFSDSPHKLNKTSRLKTFNSKKGQSILHEEEKPPESRLEKKIEYSYTGLWKFGIKHGKGTENVHYFYKNKNNQFQDLQNTEFHMRKTVAYQSFRYEGHFIENSKQGKGMLTYVGSNKNDNLVKKDKQKVERKLVNQGDQIQSQINDKIKLRQQQEQQIQQKLDSLDQQKFKASHLKLKKEGALIYDLSFRIEAKFRTIFNESYTGDFREGKMDGQGTYVWPNGKTYKGKWKDNQLHGKGEFYWPDGTYFQGDYENDERNGQGIIIWNPQKRYRGSWAFGMRHGYGQSIEVDQKKKQLIIKRALWDRDEVKVPFPEYTFQDFIFKERLDTEEDQANEKQKQKEKNSIFNFRRIKQAATKFSSSSSPRQN